MGVFWIFFFAAFFCHFLIGESLGGIFLFLKFTHMVVFKYLKYVLPYKDDPPGNPLWNFVGMVSENVTRTQVVLSDLPNVLGDKVWSRIESPGTFDFHPEYDHIHLDGKNTSIDVAFKVKFCSRTSETWGNLKVFWHPSQKAKLDFFWGDACY